MITNNSLIERSSEVLCRKRRRSIVPLVLARLHQVPLLIFLMMLTSIPASAIGRHSSQTMDVPPTANVNDTNDTTNMSGAASAAGATNETDAPNVPAVTKTTPANKSGKTERVIESPIHYVGVPYKYSNRKDPFWAPSKPKSIAQIDEEASRGVPPPGIAGTFVTQAILEGISIRNDRRTAIVRGRDNRAYFLRAGDKLFDGYLKTIQEDSITMVREIIMKSGKTLTQEVTKRLRTP